jgi:hypothetical protein
MDWLVLSQDEVDDSRTTLQYVPLSIRTCRIDGSLLDMHYLNCRRMSRKQGSSYLKTNARVRRHNSRFSLFITS